MVNFKRHRPKAARSGCLLCKPWKVQGNSKHAVKASVARRLQPDRW